MRDYDASRLEEGPWATVFRASERGRTSVREELVLGMTAHIVSDLPQVLCDVGMTSESGASRIGDYHLMNEVLGQAIERIQVELSRRYDPLLGLLDQPPIVRQTSPNTGGAIAAPGPGTTPSASPTRACATTRCSRSRRAPR